VCFTFQTFKFHLFFSFHLLLIFSQISAVIQARPPPILRAKESKASITNEDEERVIREGQLELPPLRTRGLGFFYFYVFYVYKVWDGAGQGRDPLKPVMEKS
jgi:hypothetical protein